MRLKNSWCAAWILPESGRELKSPHSNNWTEWIFGGCFLISFFSWSTNIMVWKKKLREITENLKSWHFYFTWISLTSQNSGSQWIWHVASKIYWKGQKLREIRKISWNHDLMGYSFYLFCELVGSVFINSVFGFQ